ncbi:MAG: hypothetical protein R2771_16145 [Saprospiraceae bacterium]
MQKQKSKKLNMVEKNSYHRSTIPSNKASLVAKIAELVNDGILKGISKCHDEKRGEGLH